jgi:HSP20 family protein
MATLVRYNTRPGFFGRSMLFNYQQPAPVSVPVNVKEDEAAFHLEVAAPGLQKEAFTVNLENNTLTVAYRHEAPADATAAPADHYTRKEFGVSAFSRSFKLPATVNAEQIQATYTNGILTIDLPKLAPKPENAVKEIAVG